MVRKPGKKWKEIRQDAQGKAWYIKGNIEDEKSTAGATIYAFLVNSWNSSGRGGDGGGMGGEGFFREGKRSGERNEEVPMKDQTNIIQISKPVSPDPALVTIFGSLYRDN